ncbi:hypothetical protein HT665_09285 [Ursidibacter maritimus]|uniref:Uncharacterized protein n=1 Tax=Ursidibacter maritimus TaxID=1331689 RepID=A0A949WH37_9PAST|nr:hypothetical protein [Ursidibacter maritimus]KAE9540218.1 hypothetical protein A1D26_00590 [Ursidibacter maritimus]MBV6524865.1 hypothetical protein [Ursidibacter maritimus]MBV6526653.1 hypothetical protein [Ursidibacter maritimus]MBV6528591.1 hypothetical protein [Ursidibacter maritimus]MBV6530419.1 hypothetical protein [Ursidibacter maritimus]
MKQAEFRQDYEKGLVDTDYIHKHFGLSFKEQMNLLKLSSEGIEHFVEANPKKVALIEFFAEFQEKEQQKAVDLLRDYDRNSALRHSFESYDSYQKTLGAENAIGLKKL